jgi:hypothetical protein
MVTELWPFHVGRVLFEVQLRQTDEEEFMKGDSAAENEMIPWRRLC